MTTNLMEESNDPLKFDPNKNYLEELVGDGRKFKTPEELAKGKYMSDVHISTLERINDELREDLLKTREQAVAAERLQELLNKLEQNADLTSRNTPSNEDKGPGVDLTQVESLVSSKLQEMKLSEKQEANRQLVEAKLTERFGSNYKSVLKDQAKALELTDDEVNQMASNKPNLFLKTFGLDTEPKVERFQTPVRSEVRSSNFAPNVQKRTLSYYQNLRKENPQLYFDRKIAVQMDQDAQALGKDFFDVQD